jgi:glycosyltransferase involved in cell wall biosynthesis
MLRSMIVENKVNKKILISINNLGVGGAERLVVDDINEMIHRGLDVHLLTFKKEKTLSLMHECRLSKDKIVCMDMNTIWDLRGWARTYFFIKTLKPEKVFSHLWFSNVVTLVVCRFVGIKNIIIFEHNIYDTIKNKKMYCLDRLLQRLPKKIVAVSSPVKDSLVQHGIQGDRVVVLNNGIPIAKYSITKNVQYRALLGIPEDAFVFVTIGRLIEQKGIDILIQAFSRGLPGAHVLIVGQGPKEKELKNMVAQQGLVDHVHFLGVRKDIPDILATSDCFVLASRWEGLGIVVLEAMASKLPIIISNFKAGKDMIEHGVQGLVVECENQKALHDEMRRLMGDGSLQQRLADAAYKRVADFSIEHHVNKILVL